MLLELWGVSMMRCKRYPLLRIKNVTIRNKAHELLNQPIIINILKVIEEVAKEERKIRK